MTKRIDSHHECHCTKKNPAVGLKVFAPTHEGVFEPLHHTVVFVVDGMADVSVTGEEHWTKLKKGDFIFLPLGVKLLYRSEGSFTVLPAGMIKSIPECHIYRANKLQDVHKDKVSFVHKLSADEHINNFIKGLVGTLRANMKCEKYFHAKAQEFAYLLYAYYTDEQRSDFFSLIASPNMAFSEAVRAKLGGVHSIAEMAKIMNMCPHTFARKCKAILGMSPKEWIETQRSKQIYDTLCQSHRTIKDVAEEFGFSNQSNFTRYCRRNYGKSPGELRQKLDTCHF